MGYPPTKEQEHAIECALKGTTMKLNAFAGAGKTSTLVLMAEALKEQGKKGLYLAFNKSIAQEAQKKMPSNVVARTYYSLALSSSPAWLTKKLSKAPITVRQLQDDFGVQPLWIEQKTETYKQNKKTGLPEKEIQIRNKRVTVWKFLKMIGIAQNVFVLSEYKRMKMSHAKDAVFQEYPELWKSGRETFESLSKTVFNLASELWADYVSPNGEYGISGNHNVYLKFWANNEPLLKKYDFILFDEAQDADGLILKVLQEQSKNGIQCIYVGDKHQQIYGWRGAVNAIEKIDAEEVFLTQSFRFGEATARLCQPLLSYMGEKNQIKGFGNDTVIIDDDFDYKDIDAILCRTNAGAVQELINLHLSGVKAGIMFDTASAIKLLEDIHELDEYSKEKEIDLGNPETKAYKTKNGKLNFRSWEELVLCVKDYGNDPELNLMTKVYSNNNYQEIMNVLKSSKSTDGKIDDGVVVCTAHKSKGLEWNNVGLSTDFIDKFFRVKDGEISGVLLKDAEDIYSNREAKRRGINQNMVVPICKKTDNEEIRLLYVAVTRAQKKLYLSANSFLFEFYFLLRPITHWDLDTNS